MKWIAVAATAFLLGIGSAAAQPPRPGFAPIPPPRYEIVPPPPPGARVVWEPGHWHWDGMRFIWIGGHYIEQRRGHYAEGRWVWAPFERRWVWRPARWE